MSSQWTLPPVLLLSTLPIAALTNAAPSFDCAKATGAVEQRICDAPELAALDRQMADVYPRALANLPADERPRAQAMQRGWLKGRNDCWKADDLDECVMTAYQTRTVALQITGGLLEVPAAVGFTCEGQEQKPMFAVFYHQTEPPSSVLTWGDDQVILLHDRSASGARYRSAEVVFWSHQGEATVEWDGTTLHCRQR